MLQKRFVNIVKQISLLPKAKYDYHPLFIQKSFHYSPSFTPYLKPTFKTSLVQIPKASFSSFKDDFNEENEDQNTILTEFEQLLQKFQQSYDSGKYPEAREHLEKSAELMRKVNCQNSLQYVEILLNIVATVKKYNLNERIISALLEAEGILDGLPDGNYSHKQVVFSHLSYEYDLKKDAGKTVEYLIKLLQLFEKTGIDSMEVVQINERVGELYIQLNKLEEAIPFFKKAVELLQANNAANNKNYLKILDDLSYIYYNLERFEPVIELRLKTLKVEQNLSGKQSLTYVSHLKNIGLIYKRLQNYEKYVQSLEEAMQYAVKLQGGQASALINEIKENLGIYYFYNKHQYEKAIPLLESVLSVLSLENSQSKYLYFLRAIAECHKNLKQYEQSKQKFMEVLAILNNQTEKGCEYAYILSQVGLAHYNLDQYQQSLDYYLKSVAIEQTKHGKQSQTCLQIYQNIAQLYYLLGNQAKSNEYLALIDQNKHLATKHH